MNNFIIKLITYYFKYFGRLVRELEFCSLYTYIKVSGKFA